MSKKLAFASILLLTLGVLTIPTGIVADKFLDDSISANLSTGLVSIRDESFPIIEGMVNATLASMIMLATLSQSYGNEIFFNEDGPSGNITYENIPISCISFYYGENLSYTLEAQLMLLQGNSSRNIPGLISDVMISTENTAWGMIHFLENYLDALNNDEKKSIIQEDYNCSWDQISKLYNYITVYYYNEIIPVFLANGIHLNERPDLSVVDNSTLGISWYLFLQQWANGTLVPDPGFPMPLGFMNLYGFELGIPVSSNMSWESVSKLWNVSWEYSLLNARGMERWKIAIDDPRSSIASYLQSVNGLTDEQTIMVLDWIEHFEHDMMPYLAQYLYKLPIDLTSLSDLLNIGGIFIGSIMIILSTIIMFGNKVKKSPKEKGSISKQVSNHVFLSGLNGKEYEPENDYNQNNDEYNDEVSDNYE